MSNIQNNASDERRKFIRLTANHIVSFEAFRAGTFSQDQESLQENSTTKNISANGVLFESPAKYGIGETLKLEVNVPGWEKYKTEFYKEDKLSGTKPLVILAKVVRVEAINDELFEIGVCFVGIDENHHNALIKYITKAIKEA